MKCLGTPLIAAVNGPEVGAGCDITLASDVRSAGEDMHFGGTIARLGLMSGAGGTWLLPRLAGVANVGELIDTGEVIDARRTRSGGKASGTSTCWSGGQPTRGAGPLPNRGLSPDTSSGAGPA